MKLIKQKYNYHVSLDTVEEFEQIILSDATITTVNETNKLFSKGLLFIWKVLTKNKEIAKIKVNAIPKSEYKPVKSGLFTILMGLDFGKCLPYFIFYRNKSLFMFDAWPNEHENIIKFVDFFKVSHLFLTSSQAVNSIQTKVSHTKCYWVPEGIAPHKYKYYDYDEKSIDVLALGRRYDTYHEQIVTCLENNNKCYLYEKQRGNIIFPTRDGFIEGLAKSKISICVPSNITHPDRSGNIETMTIRYLQSMVSKCLIVGHAPKEMITLFGYNPVIEIDDIDPEGQIVSILNNYTDYHHLVDKNYQMVLKYHTWENRWCQIQKLLN